MKSMTWIVLMFCSYFTYGQFSKGDKYIDGSFHFSYRKSPVTWPLIQRIYENTDRSFWVIPSLGFLFSEKYSCGVRVGYTNEYQKKINVNVTINEQRMTTTVSTSNALTGGLFVRRFFNVSDKFVFSLIGFADYNRGIDKRNESYIGIASGYNTLGYNISVSNIGYSNMKLKYFQVFAGIRPNFIFFPSPKWGFDVSFGNIGYSYSNNYSNFKSGSHLFNLNYGEISFGLSYYFRKARE